LYFSLFEWFNPYFRHDHKNHGKTNTYVKEIMRPQLHEICETYFPEIIWSDGDWDMNPSYWESEEFLAWLYNESPMKETVVVNDRWGNGTNCLRGDFWTCSDRFLPNTLVTHKWENCLTIDKWSWGYRRNIKMEEVMSIQELLATLVQTVALGGNMLLNVGPTPEGTIIPIFRERLLEIGAWLDINGEAIYRTIPNGVINRDNATSTVWYTKPKYVKNITYAISTVWPVGTTLILKSVTPQDNQTSEISLVGLPNVKLTYRKNLKGITIDLPNITPNFPVRHSYVFKLMFFTSY